MASQNEKQSKTNQAFMFIVVGALLVLGGAYYFAVEAQENFSGTENIAEEASKQAQEAITPDSGSIDVDAALTDRILGNPDAPIKISEHSSFTCGHCGAFHKNTFKQLKAGLIDTGRAYLVFSDFPLNAPALHASMTARCVPQDRYFDFVQMLFETQEEWAYEANYREKLKTKAADYGLENDRFEACLDSKELQEGLIQKMQAVQKQWEIRSTPSFVINNDRVVSGALPYDEFEKIIEEEAPKAGE